MFSGSCIWLKDAFTANQLSGKATAVVRKRSWGQFTKEREKRVPSAVHYEELNKLFFRLCCVVRQMIATVGA